VVVPWKYYLRVRGIEDGLSEPVFPAKYTVAERDTFYKTICNSQWAGANGIDSVLIAYDGLLGCKGDWTELCLRAMLHGGDNDSTGCIAGSLYGALYGFSNVPENNYKVINHLSFSYLIYSKESTLGKT
jgi:ADP-ribosylglycohydrolase